MRTLNEKELQSIDGGCLLFFFPGFFRPAPKPQPSQPSTDITVNVTVDVTGK